MGHNTENTQAMIESTQYSNFILRQLPESTLPESFARDVTDFDEGTTLNIPTVGQTTLQEVFEDQELQSNAIDTGTITFNLTDYIGERWHVTDELRQEGNAAKINAVHHAKSMGVVQAIAEYEETRLFALANAAQTDANANNINGFAHRIASGETNDVAKLQHFRQMSTSFDKARAPQFGRVAIVDSVVAATIEDLFGTSAAISYNPHFEGIVTSGFTMGHRFVRNIYGWDIYTSNLLPKSGASGSYGDGTETVTNAVANIFMCVGDDNATPMMKAWRKTPGVTTWRDEAKRRDEFQTTGRFGIGNQRKDTLGVLITSAVNS